MARTLNKLIDTRIRTAELKPGRHSDGGGLYLNAKPGGTRSWLFLYNKDGKRKAVGIGPYPAIKLASARQRAAEFRQLVAEGGDPQEAGRRERTPTFKECSEQFLNSMEQQWRNDKHRAQWRMTLGEAYCEQILNKPVDRISTDNLLSILSPIWNEKNETASRLRGRIERVLDFAKAKGWREGENPALWRGHLQNLLPARQKLQRGHHPAMPYEQVATFYSELVGKEAMAALCLRLLILTACRSGEALNATWDEFDFENAIWTLPPERTKAGRVHRVPLTSAALDILKPLSAIRRSDLVFPGSQDERPLSGMAMTMLMRRMKRDQYTVHGFRSSFRDWAGDETDHAREVAEAALAHVSGDATERAYRRGDALAKRRRLLEEWASYVTGFTNAEKEGE